MKITAELEFLDISYLAAAFNVPKEFVSVNGNKVTVEYPELKQSKTPLFYRLKKNENAAAVARKFAIPEKAILDANKGVSMVGGVTVYVPKFSGKTYTVTPLDTIKKIAEKFGTSEELIKEKNGVSFIFAGQILIID